MLPDRVSNPGPLTYESGALPITSFSTVFQSYQDDGRLIMKGCGNRSLLTVAKISPRAGIELGPLDQ